MAPKEKCYATDPAHLHIKDGSEALTRTPGVGFKGVEDESPKVVDRRHCHVFPRVPKADPAPAHAAECQELPRPERGT